MKVIVAGGRDFNNYDLLKSKLNEFRFCIDEEIEIVCGCAKGADTLGKNYAIENNLSIIEFPANWDLHGKKAGFIRNEEMAKYSDCLIAFWNGTSSGTRHMINIASKYNLICIVENY